MEKQETAEAAGLFRTVMMDEEIGLNRLVWAVAGACPVCERKGVHVFVGEGVPERADALMMKFTPCPECADIFEQMQRGKTRRRRRKPRRAGKSK
jgi:hypothetical protein